MKQRTLSAIWDQTRQKYGIYMRLLEALPEGVLHERPIPDMRSPAELVAHTSGSIVRDIARGVAEGEIKADSSRDAAVAAGLRTKDDLLAFARECWREADEAVSTIGEEQLNAVVPSGWGMAYPGWVFLNTLSDEFLHHRGQLYAYARASGAEPPFIWSFDENAPEFAPRARARS